MSYKLSKYLDSIDFAIILMVQESHAPISIYLLKFLYPIQWNYLDDSWNSFCVAATFRINRNLRIHIQA